MGWERSQLGYPVSDEKRSPDGRTRYNNFQGGSMLLTANGGIEVRSRID